MRLTKKNIANFMKRFLGCGELTKKQKREYKWLIKQIRYCITLEELDLMPTLIKSIGCKNSEMYRRLMKRIYLKQSLVRKRGMAQVLRRVGQ